MRFWGYDRSMESSFFVTWDALKHIQPDLEPTRQGICALSQEPKFIYAIAARVYSRGRKISTTSSPPIFHKCRFENFPRDGYAP